MSVQVRIVSFLLIAAVLAAAGMYVLGSTFLEPQFDRIERTQAQTYLADVQKRLDQTVEVMDAANAQNSSWTDLYAEMAAPHAAFFTEQYGTDAAGSASASAIVVLDARGRVVYESDYDFALHGRVEAPLFARTSAAERAKVVATAESGLTTKGVFRLGDRLVAVSARPILRTDGTGAGRGEMVFARVIDQSWLADASDALHATVVVDRATPADSSEHIAVDHQPHSGTTVLTDPVRTPIGTVRVEWHSALHGLASSTVLRLVAFAVLGAIIGAAGLAIAVYTVTRRHGARFRALVTNASDVIVLFDERGRISYLSPSAISLLDLRPREVVGSRMADWIEPEHAFAEALERVSGDANATAPIEIRLRRGDGTWAACEGTVTNLMWEPSVRSYVLNLHDVTEHLRTAEALAAARDEAMQATRAKSAFLASMSHEIRTPMNAVLGLDELLLTTDLDADQREYATHIHSAGTALLEIINDILDFSRVEAGKVRLEAVEFDLARVVDDVVALLLPSASVKEVRLGAAIDPAVPERVRGDALRLRQVLINLVGNAVKFTPAGSVVVRVDAVRVSDDEAALRFAVTDTGIGIDSDAVDRLFEPFSQADDSTTRTFGGTGLGLAICNEIVALMGGTLSVNSTLGEGSTFSFEITFERAQGEPAVEEVPRPAAERVTGGTVLLVEDNDVNQLVATKMLERLGYRVDVASNGVEALEVTTARRYDAVLMDCQMPVMDGYEATRRIRERERERGGREHLHVIALTAAAVGGDREACLAAGMDDYVTKPISLDALTSVLGRVPTGPSDPEPLSPDHVAMLRGLDDGEGVVLAEIASQYLESTPALFDALRGAVAEGDPEQVMRQSHTLKGASAGVGADALATILAEIEALGRGRALGEAPERVAAAAGEYERVRAALVALMQQARADSTR